MGVSVLGSRFRPMEEAVTSKARVDYFSFWWVPLGPNFDVNLQRQEGWPRFFSFS